MIDIINKQNPVNSNNQQKIVNKIKNHKDNVPVEIKQKIDFLLNNKGKKFQTNWGPQLSDNSRDISNVNKDKYDQIDLNFEDNITNTNLLTPNEIQNIRRERNNQNQIYVKMSKDDKKNIYNKNNLTIDQLENKQHSSQGFLTTRNVNDKEVSKTVSHFFIKNQYSTKNSEQQAQRYNSVNNSKKQNYSLNNNLNQTTNNKTKYFKNDTTLNSDQFSLKNLVNRKDAADLQEWLNQMISQIESNQKYSDNDKFNSLQIVFSNCMQEAVRQVGLQCANRANLIQDLWVKQNFLYQKIIEIKNKEVIKIDREAEFKMKKFHKIYSDQVENHKKNLIDTYEDFKQQTSDFALLKKRNNQNQAALMEQTRIIQENKALIKQLKKTRANLLWEKQYYKSIVLEYNAMQQGQTEAQQDFLRDMEARFQDEKNKFLEKDNSVILNQNENFRYEGQLNDSVNEDDSMNKIQMNFSRSSQNSDYQQQDQIEEKDNKQLQIQENQTQEKQTDTKGLFRYMNQFIQTNQILFTDFGSQVNQRDIDDIQTAKFFVDQETQFYEHDLPDYDTIIQNKITTSDVINNQKNKIDKYEVQIADQDKLIEKLKNQVSSLIGIDQDKIISQTSNFSPQKEKEKWFSSSDEEQDDILKQESPKNNKQYNFQDEHTLTQNYIKKMKSKVQDLEEIIKNQQENQQLGLKIDGVSVRRVQKKSKSILLSLENKIQANQPLDFYNFKNFLREFYEIDLKKIKPDIVDFTVFENYSKQILLAEDIRGVTRQSFTEFVKYIDLARNYYLEKVKMYVEIRDKYKVLEQKNSKLEDNLYECQQEILENKKTQKNQDSYIQEQQKEIVTLQDNIKNLSAELEQVMNLTKGVKQVGDKNKQMYQNLTKTISKIQEQNKKEINEIPNDNTKKNADKKNKFFKKLSNKGSKRVSQEQKIENNNSTLIKDLPLNNNNNQNNKNENKNSNDNKQFSSYLQSLLPINSIITEQKEDEEISGSLTSKNNKNKIQELQQQTQNSMSSFSPKPRNTVTGNQKSGFLNSMIQQKEFKAYLTPQQKFKAKNKLEKLQSQFDSSSETDLEKKLFLNKQLAKLTQIIEEGKLNQQQLDQLIDKYEVLEQQMESNSDSYKEFDANLLFLQFSKKVISNQNHQTPRKTLVQEFNLSSGQKIKKDINISPNTDFADTLKFKVKQRLSNQKRATNPLNLKNLIKIINSIYLEILKTFQLSIDINLNDKQNSQNNLSNNNNNSQHRPTIVTNSIQSLAYIKNNEDSQIQNSNQNDVKVQDISSKQLQQLDNNIKKTTVNQQLNHLNIICYDYFIQKYGLRQVSEKKLENFYESLQYHSKNNSRIQLFMRFCGISPQESDNLEKEDFEFYLKVLKYIDKDINCGIHNLSQGENINIRNIQITNILSNFLTAKEFLISIENFNMQIFKKINEEYDFNFDDIMLRFVEFYITHKGEIQNQIKTIFLAADLDKNGQISLEEFIMLFRCLEKQKTEDLKKAKQLFLKEADLISQDDNYEKSLSLNKFASISLNLNLFTQNKIDSFLEGKSKDNNTNFENLLENSDKYLETIQKRFMQCASYDSRTKQYIYTLKSILNNYKKEFNEFQNQNQNNINNNLQNNTNDHKNFNYLQQQITIQLNNPKEKELKELKESIWISYRLLESESQFFTIDYQASKIIGYEFCLIQKFYDQLYNN